MDIIRVVIVLFSVCIALCAASNIGDSCTSDSTCDSYGQYCKIYSNCAGKGQCSCKSGYESVAGACKMTKLIEDSCDTNSVCPGLSSCVSGKCKCNNGYRASGTKKYCVLNAYKLIGEQCTTGNTCYQVTGTSSSTPTTTTTSNAACQNGFCECTNGYKASENMCIKYGYGEACSSSSTGTGQKTCNEELSYECSNGKCVCTADHTYYSPEKKCVYTSAERDVAEGKICNHDGNSGSNKWCAEGLSCTTCPSASTKLCRKEMSDGSATLSLSLVAAAAVLMNLLL